MNKVSLRYEVASKLTKPTPAHRVDNVPLAGGTPHYQSIRGTLISVFLAVSEILLNLRPFAVDRIDELNLHIFDIRQAVILSESGNVIVSIC